MTKETFLDALDTELARQRLSAEEAHAAREYYADTIDERMDDGLSEREAVACMGSPAACAQTVADETAPIPHLIHRLATRFALVNLILAILTFPVWGLLAAAFVLVVAGAYITLFSLLLCAWLFFGCGILLGSRAWRRSSRPCWRACPSPGSTSLAWVCSLRARRCSCFPWSSGRPVPSWRPSACLGF